MKIDEWKSIIQEKGGKGKKAENRENILVTSQENTGNDKKVEGNRENYRID